MGDGCGRISIPRPSSNLERLPFLESYVSSSLVRWGKEAYCGRDIRIAGDPKGDISGGGFERSMAWVRVDSSVRIYSLPHNVVVVVVSDGLGNGHAIAFAKTP